VGAVCGAAASNRRERSHHQATSAVRTMKTARPAQGLITPAIAIAAK